MHRSKEAVKEDTSNAGFKEISAYNYGVNWFGTPETAFIYELENKE